MIILNDITTNAKLWQSQVHGNLMEDLINQCDKLEYKYEFGRGTCWLGDRDLDYRYANRSHVSQGWQNSVFIDLTERMRILVRNAGFGEEENEPLFNHLLVNQYTSKQKLAMHKDNEPDLIGPIASLSLGAETKFKYGLSKSMKEAESISLINGHILIGNRGFFNNYYHSVSAPSISTYTPVRYNLTWRTINSD